MARFIFNGTQEEFAATRAFIESSGLVIDRAGVVGDTLVVWSGADLTQFDGFVAGDGDPLAEAIQFSEGA